MKLFLVGPKFDLPRSNFPAFAQSAAYWRNLDHEVVSSPELDIIDGADPDQGWAIHPPSELIPDLFRRDVAELVKCDGVVLLDGWRNDDTCQLMVDIAYSSDMILYEQILSGDRYRELEDEEDNLDEPEEFEFYPENSAPSRNGLDTRFSDVVRQMEELHYKKQKDYGHTSDPFANVRASEDFGIPGWVGAVIRGNDKMKRLQKFAQGDNLVNESVEDSFLDLAVYSIIGLILFNEESGE